MIIVISIKLFVKGFKQILSEALDNGSKLLDKVTDKDMKYLKGN